MLLKKIGSIDLTNLFPRPRVPPKHNEDVCMCVTQVIWRQGKEVKRFFLTDTLPMPRFTSCRPTGGRHFEEKLKLLALCWPIVCLIVSVCSLTVYRQLTVRFMGRSSSIFPKDECCSYTQSVCLFVFA